MPERERAVSKLRGRAGTSGSKSRRWARRFAGETWAERDPLTDREATVLRLAGERASAAGAAIA